ncbi:MAG: HlyD family type I secretion periplasmic adaptor subunit [Endozoicomonadaceae bacterium]|nr:HlyD family type I secretion periplasmic adaptor subunit [Endozoicomonadaceae bacterium]
MVLSKRLRTVKYCFIKTRRQFWSSRVGCVLRHYFPRFREKNVERRCWFSAQPELEFMSESSAAMLLNTAYLTRLLILGLAAFLLSVTLWAALTQLDEITRGQGKVIPSSRLQTVQNLEGGIVKNIFVEEGDEVKKNQSLIELDDTQFASNYREKELDYFSNMTRMVRLKAEINMNKMLEFPNELEKYGNYREREIQLFNNSIRAHVAEVNVVEQQLIQANQELISIKAELRIFNKNFSLSKQEYEMTKPLADKGIVSRVQLLRLEKEVNELDSKRENAKLSIPRLMSSIDEVKGRLSEVKLKYRTKRLEELKEIEVVMDQLKTARHSLGDRVKRTMIRSPVNGVIQKLYVNTLEGVVDPGMPLVDIIPIGDSLEIEVMVNPRDIAFIHLGLKAVVKLTAYDFTIYGGLDGEVVHVSADTIENEKGDELYVVRIKTHESYLGSIEHPLPIMSGMQVSTDIITGQKTLLAYLMKPILRARSRAFTER